MQSFTKAKLASFRTDFAKAVKDLEDQYDMTIKLGTIRFETNQFSTKLSATGNDNMGQTVTKESLDFKQKAYLYGMKSEDLGKVFTVNGLQYVLKGLNTRAKKFPFIGQRVTDGRSFKFPTDSIKNLVEPEVKGLNGAFAKARAKLG